MHISFISIILFTLYIDKALYLRVVPCIEQFTFYCLPVVVVSYVVNGEIKRPGRIITICCIKSWWLIYKVFTFTNFTDSKPCDICRIIVISYCTPASLNTTVKWLSVVSGNIYSGYGSNVKNQMAEINNLIYVWAILRPNMDISQALCCTHLTIFSSVRRHLKIKTFQFMW